MIEGAIRIRRALFSVTDKTGIEELARAFEKQGVEILATGGTAAALAKAKIKFRSVEDFAGSPEAFDGRVKTLTFKLQAAILHDRMNATHVEEAARLGVDSVDCVVCNFYDFNAALAAGATESELVAKIDIGGPNMVRAAAKNFSSVLVLTNPAGYPQVISEFEKNSGSVSLPTRRAQMAKALENVAAYDRQIADAFMRKPLKYGENPHQNAWFVQSPGASRILWGESRGELSYNNMLDAQAAWGVMMDAAAVAPRGHGVVVVIKHNNPCGLATGSSIDVALERAWAGDPVSAFGGVLATSSQVTREFARALKGRFVEVLLAPGFEEGVLEELQNQHKKMRVIPIRPAHEQAVVALSMRTCVEGGELVQTLDEGMREDLKARTSIRFDDSDAALAKFGIVAAKWIKSNAIALVRTCTDGGFQLVGMGSGQPNRIDALKRLALPKTREYFPDADLAGCILVSDAFFPFADTVEVAAEAGIRKIVQPGGSIRDDEVIAACDRLGVAMVTTGRRHFKH